MNKQDIDKLACSLIRGVTSVECLKGGINSRVFKIVGSESEGVLKYFNRRFIRGRDQMQAEVEMLEYSSLVCPRYVPRLLELDMNAGWIFIELVNGTLFGKGCKEPGETDIEAAKEFFYALNSDNVLAREHIKMRAADGFLTLSEHVEEANRRVMSMEVTHLPEIFYDDSLCLLDELKRYHLSVTEEVRSDLEDGYITDGVDVEMMCVSPGDFGFHNAIRSSSGTKFIDFEFGGWDDPVKTDSDFILQPRIPIRQKSFTLLDFYPEEMKATIATRKQVMLKILRVKWISIILSILIPSRYDEMKSDMSDGETAKLIAERLAHGRSRLSQTMCQSA